MIKQSRISNVEVRVSKYVGDDNDVFIFIDRQRQNGKRSSKLYKRYDWQDDRDRNRRFLVRGVKMQLAFFERGVI